MHLEKYLTLGVHINSRWISFWMQKMLQAANDLQHFYFCHFFFFIQETTSIPALIAVKTTNAIMTEKMAVCHQGIAGTICDLPMFMAWLLMML